MQIFELIFFCTCSHQLSIVFDYTILNSLTCCRIETKVWYCTKSTIHTTISINTIRICNDERTIRQSNHHLCYKAIVVWFYLILVYKTVIMETNAGFVWFPQSRSNNTWHPIWIIYRNRVFWIINFISQWLIWVYLDWILHLMMALLKTKMLKIFTYSVTL